LTDGLFVHLDAKNSNSFSGGTWKNLDTSSNDLTLVKSPVYSESKLYVDSDGIH